MKKIIFFCITQILLSFNISAQNIYVTPNGTASQTDPDAGTPDNPYNLDDALFIANNGATLLLEGVFQRSTNVFGINKNGLTIRPVDEDAIAIIQANEDLADTSIFLFTLNESNDITIEDITFKGSQDPTSNGLSLLNLGNNNNVIIDNVTIEENWGNNGVGLNIFGRGDTVIVRECNFRNMGWTNDVDSSPFFVIGQDEDGNDIFSCNDSSGAVVIGNENDGSYTNITFEENNFNNLITGCAEALTLTGNVDGFMVKNNILSDNSNIGIALAGHYDTVQDCDFTVNPPVCIDLATELNQTRNGYVTGNEVIRSIFPQNLSTPAGIYCDGCKDVIIERNLVKESGVGISIGVENGGGFTATNVTVINNKLIRNVFAGLTLGSSLNIDNVGEEPSSVNDCIIRNNTFYRNGTSDNFFFNQEVLISRSDNNHFFNNILYVDNNSMGIISAVLEIGGVPTNQEATNFMIAHNLYFRENESQEDLVVSAGSPLPLPSGAYFENPEFINPDADDFSISNSSIAANAGLVGTQITSEELDFSGNFRIYQDTQIDIGAFETTSTDPPVDPNFFESNIINFQIPNQEESVIDIDNHTILITMPDGTNITNLIPDVIEVSFAADVNPAEGVAQDFSEPFTYQVTAGNSFTQDWIVTVESATLGLLENIKDSFQIYPNPSNGIVFLGINSEVVEEITINVYNLNGSLIDPAIHFKNGSTFQNKRLDFKNLSSGLYIITIEAGEQFKTFKLVKQ
ncbi:T9SS type A sorting domain-containing protein [uncultured Dokdonia sp.]|uniref:T9SS type A sorting domain-containing protein n=1 Tax=uncultured Dokdonia sp. TaxID=575653 RepID=UPI00261018E0|nr:T9SS type A sorting domain-containing protein [uncultured Dokdonia sp.]